MHICADRLFSFYSHVFRAFGLPDDYAVTSARGLFYADLHGIDSHGTANLVPIYVNKLRRDEIRSDAKPRIVKKRDSAAIIDGDRSMGFISASLAMDEAIQMASEHGCGTVGLRHATHAGALGFYINQALERGCIAMAATNLGSQAIVAPPGGRPLVGTNVLAFGVPARAMPHFLLDMSTAAASTGKIRVLRKRGEPIPAGWIFGSNGEAVTDPSALDRGEAFVAPLGGQSSWYKGFGLALFCELICGAFAGACTAPESVLHGMSGTDHDIGLWFLAIHPSIAGSAQEFPSRVDQILASVLESSAEGDNFANLSYPGQLEAETAARRYKTGIPLDTETVRQLKALAAELNIDF